MTHNIVALKRLIVIATVAFATACVSLPSNNPFFEEPQSSYGAFLAARYADVVSDPASAAVYYQRALELEPGNPLLVERAFDAALAVGDIDSAINLARRAEPLKSGDELARIVLASHAMKQRRYRAAVTELKGGGLGPFNELERALLLAWANAGQGSEAGALAALADVSDAPAFDQLMIVHKAMLLEWFGRIEEAEEAYVAALETSLLPELVVDAYGRMLERDRRPTQAHALYTARLAEDLDDPASLAGLKRIEAGDRPRALVTSPVDGASIALFAPAATLAARSSSQTASIYLRLAVYVDKDNALARYYLGQYLRKRQMWADARGVLQQIEPSSAYHVAAYVASAMTLFEEERETEAVGLLEWLAETTDAPAARAALGLGYRAVERFAEGAEVYDTLIGSIDGEPETRHWAWYYARGICNERSGRWEVAEPDFQKALELAPDHPSVLNYLGYTWVDRGERLDEAFDLIRRAVELRPNEGFIVDSLGWAHYRLGDYDLAVEHLERAVELEPENPEINDHLGDAYWQVGRQLEAVFQWRRALSLAPGERLQALIEAKLDEGPSGETAARVAAPATP